MFARVREKVGASGIIWCMAIAVIVALGCGRNSPFLALQFADSLTGLGGGGGTRPATSQDNTTTIDQTCDLDPAKRGISVVLANEAQQFVRYSITFIASAGPGGFVCDEDLNDYFAAGYRDTILDVGNGATFGCDIVRLLGGTRMLSLRVADTLAQNVTGGNDPANIPLAQPPLNGNTFIPLPELIVLGDADPIFTCTGNNLCTQRGFVYTDVANTPIAFVNVSRTQDTVCNSRAGTAPEWRLADLNKADNQASPFQFVAGGGIGIVVLDRANNANVNVNQVIWTVVDINGNIIHAARR